MELKYPEEKYEFADKLIVRDQELLRITKKYEDDVRPEVKVQRNFLYGRYCGYVDVRQKCAEQMDDIVGKLKLLEEDWGEPQNE